MTASMKIETYPGFAAGRPADPYAWSRDELLALAADNAERDRAPFPIRDALANSREECDALYFATRSGGGVDDLRPAVQYEAPLDLLAGLEMPAHPRLALAAHRVATILAEIAAEPGEPSTACHQRWCPVTHRPNGSTRRMILSWHTGYGLRPIEANCHGLRVFVDEGVCTITVKNHRFSFDRRTYLSEVKAPFNDAQVPRLRRLVSAWRKLRREWIGAHVVVGMAGYHSSAGDVAALLFVPHPTARGMKTADAYPLNEGFRYPAKTGAVVLDTDYIDRAKTYLLAGDLSQCARYDLKTDIDKAFLSYLPETIGVLRAPMPTTAELMASLDPGAAQFIKAQNVRGQPVALDDPEAASYTVFQDDMTFPRALTTTKWLSTAIDIERDNRKDVTYRLRMEIGTGSRAKQSA